MTQQDINDRVREYICENFLYMRQEYEFSDTDSLLGHGILDSMGVIELITFLQDEFAIQVGDEEITEDNLGTLEAIAGYVHAKRAASLAA